MFIEQITQNALSLNRALKLELIDTLLNSLASDSATPSQNKRIQEAQKQRDNICSSSIPLETQAIQTSKSITAQLIGIAKTDSLPPTDAEVAAMLDERLAQKYL